MNQDDLDYAHASWRKKYSSILNDKKPVLYCKDPNCHNTRCYMSRDSSCMAYRSALFYVQLSPRIEPKIIEMALKATWSDLNNYVANKRGQYFLLFLNDEKGQLIYNKRPETDWSRAVKVCGKFICDLSKSNYAYSKELSQLFPKSSPHRAIGHPGRDELCVLITDSDGVVLADEVKNSILRKCNKLVRIVADKGADVCVEKVSEFK